VHENIYGWFAVNTKRKVNMKYSKTEIIQKISRWFNPPHKTSETVLKATGFRKLVTNAGRPM